MRTITMLFLLSALTIHADAQFQRRSVEMSLSGTFGSLKMSDSKRYSSPEALTYLFISTGVEYFITDGISVGPQIGLLAAEDEPPAQSVLMNLSYTKRLDDSRTALFIRCGYGKANTISLPFYGGVVPYRIDKDWLVNVYTVGAGVKFLVSDGAALKVEANYRNEGYSKEENYYPMYPPFQVQYGTVEREYENITLQFGFSILM
jgi:opacity protein-like surface antigen